MVTSYQDISIVLSGGNGNIDPNQSLGGSPSTTVLTSGLNNLFSNASPDPSSDGITDYRCVYIFNDGDSAIYNLKIWIDSEIPLGSSVELGLDLKNEIQSLTFSGIIDEGDFRINYTTESGIYSTELINFNSNPVVLALDIQNSLNDLKDGNGNFLLENVVVSGSVNDDNFVFQVTFQGADGNKNHDLLTVENNLIGTNTNIVVNTNQVGSPVNTIAPSLDDAETTPFGVSFSYPVKQNPMIIKKIFPTEGFPLWVKRNTLSSTETVENDGFVLGLNFAPFRN